MSATYFIAGTDTDVGKTTVATGLLYAARQSGLSTAAGKPVASGCDVKPKGLRNPDAVALRAECSVELTYNEVNPVAFEPAIAPHLAAREAGVALTVLSIELAKAGIQHEGVDKIFHNQAVLDGRPVLGLESVDQHLSYVTGMGQGAEDDFILQTLEDARKTHESLRKIINAWRIGDQPALEAEVIDNMPQDYPQLYARLLVERNNNWMPQIIQMLDTPEQELVLVGAAHLVGPDGLLAQLLEKGYQIKQLP